MKILFCIFLDKSISEQDITKTIDEIIKKCGQLQYDNNVQHIILYSNLEKLDLYKNIIENRIGDSYNTSIYIETGQRILDKVYKLNDHVAKNDLSDLEEIYLFGYQQKIHIIKIAIDKFFIYPKKVIITEFENNNDNNDNNECNGFLDDENIEDDLPGTPRSNF